MSEIRGRIVWGMIGFFALSNGIEELIMRLGIDTFGKEKIMTIFSDWIVELIERSWFIPWFLVVLGAGMILVAMFSKVEE
jgi:hypothetical protein